MAVPDDQDFGGDLRGNLDEQAADAAKRTGGPSGPTAEQPEAKRVQKADREKQRRDRLNEQFQELAAAIGETGNKKSSSGSCLVTSLASFHIP